MHAGMDGWIIIALRFFYRTHGMFRHLDAVLSVAVCESSGLSNLKAAVQELEIIRALHLEMRLQWPKSIFHHIKPWPFLADVCSTRSTVLRLKTSKLSP